MRGIRIAGIRRILRMPWRQTVTRDIDEEIRFHLDERTAELIRAGVVPAEARDQARAEYGNVGQSRQELERVDRRRLGRVKHRETFMSFAEDVRQAARGLSHRPALYFVITLTLAIGIASNAVMFGVVDQLLLSAPPHIENAGHVRRLYFHDMENGEGSYGSTTTYPVLTRLREQSPAFSDLAAYGYPGAFTVGRGRDARRVTAQLVSGNFFRLLGVRPAVGRAFVDNDDRVPDGEAVAVLSYGYWNRAYAGDSSVIGRALTIDRTTFTIVGVAPRGFSGVDRQRIDVWVPISAFANEAVGKGWHNTTNSWWAEMVGRVRQGVEFAVAEQQATAAYRTLVREWHQTFRDSTSSVVLSSIIGARSPDGLSSESRVALWLTGVAVVVMLIACANAGNLLVARTLERRREIAVRTALGVSRWRLARLLFCESALLAVSGAAAAIALAWTTSQLVQKVLLPTIVWNDTVIDARMLLFTLVVTCACVLLAGVAPAFIAARVEVASALKASSRQVAGGRGRLRFALMLVQAALSVMLLVGAGLFVDSLRRVSQRDIGIDRDRVLRVTMALDASGFNALRVKEVYAAGAQRIRAIPGVASVAVAGLSVPTGMSSARGFSVPGIERPDFKLGGPYESVVDTSFFPTIGARIVAGRNFTAADEQAASRSVIVNETLANGYWPNETAVGKCVQFMADSACSEIVGVVQDVMQYRLINDARAFAYTTTAHPSAKDVRPAALLVRTSITPEHVRNAVQSALQDVAPDMPYIEVRLFDELVASQLQPWRLGAAMFTLFGVIALVISAIGLYSVISYWVAQRTHEIGIRMALGAQRRHVIQLVAGQSSRAIVVGLVVGSLAAFVASRWLKDLLFETSPHDPSAYLTAAGLLTVAGCLATLVPLRRSTAVDPAQSIRSD